MPKIAATLTADAVAKLAAVEGVHVTSPGLYLQVQAGGIAASWVMRYQFKGRARSKGLGAYVAGAGQLKVVRDQVDALRVAMRGPGGVDPLAAKQGASFAEVAAQCAKTHGAGWSKGHAHDWRTSLYVYAFPTLGHMKVSEIGVPEVLQVLTPIWNSKTSTASRLRNRIEQVLDFAHGLGLRPGLENCARWRGGLKSMLAPPHKIHKVEHFVTLPVSEIPELMARLAQRDRTRSRALAFMILTSARTGNVCAARWSQITGDIWTVSASEMKNGQPWRCPLSKQALALIPRPPTASDGDFIFPGRRGGALDGDVMRAELRCLGYKADGHGARSGFRNWAKERGVRLDVAEFQLAHVEGSATRKSYESTDLLTLRAPVMQAWADVCTAPVGGDNVVQLRG
jgi:integrase